MKIVASRWWSLGYAAALVLIPCAPAAAQQMPRIDEGARVRVTLGQSQNQDERWTTPQQLQGVVIGQRGDSLTLQIHPAATPVTVWSSGVRRLEVSLGTPDRVENAMRQGFLFAAVGAVYFPVADALERDRQFSSAPQAALVGAASGIVGGVVLGALFPGERWRRVR